MPLNESVELKLKRIEILRFAAIASKKYTNLLKNVYVTRLPCAGAPKNITLLFNNLN